MSIARRRPAVKGVAKVNKEALAGRCFMASAFYDVANAVVKVSPLKAWPFGPRFAEATSVFGNAEVASVEFAMPACGGLKASNIAKIAGRLVDERIMEMERKRK